MKRLGGGLLWVQLYIIEKEMGSEDPVGQPQGWPVFPSRGRSTAAASGIRNLTTQILTPRMALRPDAARIPRKRRIKFLTPSGRGPGPGLCGTTDGYSTDAPTGTLRLRLKTVEQVQQFKVQHSNVYYVHKCGIR